MKRTKTTDLYSPGMIGKEVDVMGWVRTRRGNKHVQFVALNDGSTIRSVQIVFDMTLFSDDDLRPVTTGSAIHVKGPPVELSGRGQRWVVRAGAQ